MNVTKMNERFDDLEKVRLVGLADKYYKVLSGAFSNTVIAA